MYRIATNDDLEGIVEFVDYWLSGGGKKDRIPGAGHDYFVRRGQHADYLRKYTVLLATLGSEIIGWAVKTSKGVLIHLLVAATFRGCGIGKEMLRRMNPDVVRSKSDQSSGDPAGFYRSQGFVSSGCERLGRKKNIDLFVKESGCKPVVGIEKGEVKPAVATGEVVSRRHKSKRKRSIDVLF